MLDLMLKQAARIMNEHNNVRVRIKFGPLGKRLGTREKKQTGAPPDRMKFLRVPELAEGCFVFQRS